MDVAFLGRGDTGLALLEAIIDADHDLTSIWTCRHTPEVGGDPEDFKEIAEKHRLPFKYIENINNQEVVESLKKHDPDIAVAIFWVDRIGAEVLNLVENGFINLHGGELPRYRGNAAANWAILEGEAQFGITVHKMVPEIDAGPVLAQETVPITEDTTISDLVTATREVGERLIVQVLDDFRRGVPPAEIDQHPKNALRCFPRKPSDGQLDWEASAEHLDRHVRSLGDPYPNAFTYHNTNRIDVLDVDVQETSKEFLAEPGHIINLRDNGEVWVATGDGILAIQTIQPEGESQPMQAAGYFDSIRTRLGMNIESEIRKLERRIKALETENR